MDLSVRQEQTRGQSRVCLFFHKNYEKMQTDMRKQLSLAIILYLIGFSILLTTNPQNLPLVVLIIPFVILFLALFFTFKIFMKVFASNTDKLNKKRSTQAAIMAGFPVICLLLLSIGEFSLRVFVTLLLLFLVLWFYGNRFSAK